MTKTGTVLNGAELGNERVDVAALPPGKAIAATIAEYLAAVEFFVVGSRPPRRFVLVNVSSEWPAPGARMPYPSATVTATRPTRLDMARRGPTPLDDSQDIYAPGTVLWKSGEAVAELAIDFWTNHDVERDAIAAALSGLFAPGDSGCVLLAGPAEYWCLTVRAELLDAVDRDEPTAVWSNERRLRARVVGSVDIVELRRATVLSPSFEVGVDPAEE